MPRAAEVRIGISGWTYAPWRGVFYPKGLAQSRELAYAAGIFRTIEINGTFYGLQRPESFAAWTAATPEDFVFAVKAPRFITHLLRLRRAESPLANFFASGLLLLGRKLGPVLWQFPANFTFNRERLESFLALLPHDTDAATALARRHDHRLKGRAVIKAATPRHLRHAIEIRSETFRTPAFIDLLRAYRVALVCADAVEWPRLMDLTSDFAYCRLHGSEQLYASGYDEAELDAWAERVARWATGSEPAEAERIARRAPRKKRDVFVYFDNDAKVRAPVDAQGLKQRVDRLLGSKPA